MCLILVLLWFTYLFRFGECPNWTLNSYRNWNIPKGKRDIIKIHNKRWEICHELEHMKMSLKIQQNWFDTLAKFNENLTIRDSFPYQSEEYNSFPSPYRDLIPAWFSTWNAICISYCFGITANTAWNKTFRSTCWGISSSSGTI